jgi:hypothetical protein
MRKSTALAVLAVLAAPAVATAQDFGREWLDRITHATEQERGPLTARPLEWHAGGGVAYFFDDNVFLVDDSQPGVEKTEDSIIVPFVRGTLTYVEQRFEVEADLLANYKLYSEVDNADDDEERLYFRARQTGNRYSFELVELFQHLSDPTDVIFDQRAERIVWNNVLRFSYDLDRSWAMEGFANYQLVRYAEDIFADTSDNNELRVDGSIVYRASQRWDLLLNVGWQDISYQSDNAPVDAWGWYIRPGFRAELFERFQLDALVGLSHIESDYITGTTDVEDDTVDAAVNLRWQLSEEFTLRGDYTRHFTFANNGDPYQRVDRMSVLLDWMLSESFSLNGRGQFDHAMTALGTERNYYTAGLVATWKASPFMAVDAGVTFRLGDSTDGLSSFESEYDNLIFHFGLAASY